MIVRSTVMLLVALTMFGCAPGLVGTWNGTLNIPAKPTIHVEFKVDPGPTGTATIRGGGTSYQVPMCKLAINERKLSFTIDLARNQTCDQISKPLVFRGHLGHDVLTGDSVIGARKLGIWRAYRKKPKSD